MQRNRLAVLAVLGVLGLWPAGQACAQYSYGRPQTNPFNQPAVSPYMNLNRPGTSPGINYSTLVRPQVDTYRSIQQLQTQVNMDQQVLFGGMKEAPAGFDPTAALPNTGHPTAFMSYTHFQGSGMTGQYFNAAATRPGSTQIPGVRR